MDPRNERKRKSAAENGQVEFQASQFSALQRIIGYYDNRRAAYSPYICKLLQQRLRQPLHNLVHREEMAEFLLHHLSRSAKIWDNVIWGAMFEKGLSFKEGFYACFTWSRVELWC